MGRTGTSEVAALLLLLLLLLTACGSRSSIELGSSADSAGFGAAGSGGQGPVDPEVSCPVVCADVGCAPSVLVDGTPVGWHAVDGGHLYFTTDFVDGPNQLKRVGVCDLEPRTLLEVTRFAGHGHVDADSVYVPVLDPPQVLRLPKAGGDAEVVHEHVDGDPLLTRAVYADGEHVYLSTYSFDGGMNLLQLQPGKQPKTLVASLPDPDWDPDPLGVFTFVPNVPVRYADWLVLGSALGLIKVLPDSGGTFEISDKVSVASPVAIDSGHFYLSSGDASQVRFVKLPVITSGDIEVEPIDILPDEWGIVVGARDGSVFAYDGDTLFRADENSLEIESLFRSQDLIQGAFVLGESVYVRTGEHIVRIALSCSGQEEPCFTLEP